MRNFSHTTLNSFSGRRGHTYYISFDRRKIAIGRSSDVYKGRFNGTGPMLGEYAAVKTPRGSIGTLFWCDIQISKNRKIYDLAKGFHNYYDLGGQVFRFTDSWKVLMDETAIFTRNINSNEWLIVEEYLGRNLHSFIDPEGLVKYGKCEVLEAFVHWTHAASGGSVVASNFEGAIDDEDSVFHLKTPTIHSMDQRYGFSDKGPAGIAEVLGHHTCNNLCCAWDIFPTKRSSKYPVSNSKSSIVTYDYSLIDYERLYRNPPRYSSAIS